MGIVLGEALREALGDKAGVRRFASVAVPLDEALVEVALDLSGRPFLVYEVDPNAGGEAYPLGNPPFDPQLAEEFWRAFCTSAALTLHMRMRRGRNVHHILEASFKAVARALRDAVRVEGGGVPSTKGCSAEVRPFVAVVDYGIGNLRSAEKALCHAGADAAPRERCRRRRGGGRGRRCPAWAISAVAARLCVKPASGRRASGQRPQGNPSLAYVSGCSCSTRAPKSPPGRRASGSSAAQ